MWCATSIKPQRMVNVSGGRSIEFGRKDQRSASQRKIGSCRYFQFITVIQ